MRLISIKRLKGRPLTESEVKRMDAIYGPCGPCGLCGCSDKRHRYFESWCGYVRAGDSLKAIARDFDLKPNDLRFLMRLKWSEKGDRWLIVPAADVFRPRSAA